MRLHSILVSLGLLTLATPRAPEAPRPLVGMWRVVRFCDEDSTGAMVDPLGPNPIGYFIYTPTGELSIQVMRTPVSGPLISDSAPLKNLDELDSYYFGYFGTYTITSDTTVVHHVLGGTAANYIGTDQYRTYHVRGDTLSIGAPPYPCRVLLRVHGAI